MQEIAFTINMVPVPKGRARTRVCGKFAVHYTPKKTRDAENNILAQAIKYKPDVPFQKQVKVCVRFFMPIPASMSKKDRALAVGCALPHTKKPDLDNLCKSVLDSLNGVFWRDDSIITSVEMSKAYNERPCIEVWMRGE